MHIHVRHGIRTSCAHAPIHLSLSIHRTFDLDFPKVFIHYIYVAHLTGKLNILCKMAFLPFGRSNLRGLTKSSGMILGSFSWPQAEYQDDTSLSFLGRYPHSCPTRHSSIRQLLLHCSTFRLPWPSPILTRQ